MNEESAVKVRYFNCYNNKNRCCCTLSAPKCFKCNGVCHILKDYPNKGDKFNNVSFAYDIHSPENNTSKDICVHNFNVRVFFDTESIIYLFIHDMLGFFQSWRPGFKKA